MSAADLHVEELSLSGTRRVLLIAIAGAVFAGLVFSLIVALPARAADPCQPGDNPIVCENSKTGAPWTEWDIQGAGDSSIQGFATDISVNVGSPVDFKIDTDVPDYTIDIYRTG